MNELVETWLYDPLVGRIALVVFGVLLIQVLMRFPQRSLGRYAQSSDARYRLRKFLSLARLFTRLLEEVDRSGNRIRLASATFERANLPRFDISLKDGKGSVDPKYVPRAAAAGREGSPG